MELKELNNFFIKYKKKINSAVLSDELDKLGFRNQVLTNWNCNVKNINFFGIIRTLILNDTKDGNERIYRGLSFLESLKKDEILFVKGSDNYAYFGELMSRLSIKKGLKGVIIDGKTRDSIYTKKFKKFLILSKGYSPIDIKMRGRVDKTDKEFMTNKIKIKSYDYVFADEEAVIILPKKNIGKLVKNCKNTIENEKKIIKMINNKKGIKKILENFKEF